MPYSVRGFIPTIMVIPHTKEVNVSYRIYFELIESFGLVLCNVH